MARRRSPGVHCGDMAGGGSERGRDLGRDLHVKGLSEPYCCSVSPNPHVRTAEGPAPAAGTAALQPFPLLSSLPCLQPGSGITMAAHESPSLLRCQLCPGPTRRLSKAISWAVLEKHKIYRSFPARIAAEPGDSYMQTDWRCWRVASSQAMASTILYLLDCEPWRH